MQHTGKPSGAELWLIMIFGESLSMGLANAEPSGLLLRKRIGRFALPRRALLARFTIAWWILVGGWLVSASRQQMAELTVC